jgi:hypothetical protein
MVNGKEVEILDTEHEITLGFNLESNDNEAMPKISLATISCGQHNKKEEGIVQKEIIT